MNRYEEQVADATQATCNGVPPEEVFLFAQSKLGAVPLVAALKDV